MNIYILILGWCAVMGMAGKNHLRREIVEGRRVWRQNPGFAFLAFLPLILMVAYRPRGLGDTWAYYRTYMNMPASFTELADYAGSVTKDPGYYVCAAALHVLIGQRYRLFFLIIAAFQGYAVCSLFRRYSEDFIYCMFLFVASTDYISWMCNGIRQFLAVSIILLGTHCYLRKKWLPTLIIILVASQFHRSALLVIPFLLIANGEAWNKKTVWMLCGCMLAVACSEVFLSSMDDMLQGTQYQNVVTDIVNSGDDGTNPLRVLVYSIPAILSFFCREKVRHAGRLVGFCVNMSILSSGLYIISMFTSGIFMGRIPIYCSLYSYIALVWILAHGFDRQTGRMIKQASILAYLVFYYLQMGVFGLI